MLLTFTSLALRLSSLALTNCKECAPVSYLSIPRVNSLLILKYKKLFKK